MLINWLSAVWIYIGKARGVVEVAKVGGGYNEIVKVKLKFIKGAVQWRENSGFVVS